MDKEKLDMVVQLRNWCIEEFNKLEPAVPTATLTHKDCSLVLSTVIRSIDDLIKDQVNFE
jgi:hypothetical protein